MQTLNVRNVSSFSRDLALATLCFLRVAFFSARFSRRFYRADILRLSHSSRCFLLRFCLRSSDVLGAALPTRLDFSIVDTFAYLRVPSEHPYSPRFGSHVFRGGGGPTLLPQARLPRKTISLCWVASPPVDVFSRFALSASTSSRMGRFKYYVLAKVSRQSPSVPTPRRRCYWISKTLPSQT